MSESLEQHVLIQKLREVHDSLGRTPTRDEFIKHTKGARDRIRLYFGDYPSFVAAAGLSPVTRTKKITADIFKVDIEKHLMSYKPKPVVVPQRLPNIAIISDIHWPFHCQRVIEKFYRFIEREQPEWVILNGDAWDLYSHAKFPRSHNVFTPRDEQAMARKHNEEFWREVQKLVPTAKCLQNLGNHDIRPIKRIIEAYPEAEDWLVEKMRQLFSFDGVETNHDPRQEIIIADIVIHHGFKTQLGAHRDHNLMNSVSSHTHRPGVVYRTVRGQAIWELNTGYAGDPEAKGLSYTSTKITDWVQSFGAINEDGPRVIMA